MRRWLLLDMHNLAYRALHTTGALSHRGSVTGTVYGILRDLVELSIRFNTNHIAFCFDSKESKRRDVYPEYKRNRYRSEKEMTEEERQVRREFRKQIVDLRKRHLPLMGFQNVFLKKGYEADDIIASICRRLKDKEEAIIVSSDHDLYQLLCDKVRMWIPTKKLFYTEQRFKSEWGIEPEDWPTVKAIAGCSSDNVIGIGGVAEKTAIRYLKDDLKTDSVAYFSIQDGEWEHNLRLVKLPFEGCPRFPLKLDRISISGWEQVASKLGFRSLHDKNLFHAFRRRGER